MQPEEKIHSLQNLLRDHQIDAWLVPSADPHQSEYVADRWKARAWLSGFSGSAGILVITQEKSGLWTDPRYHIRAAQELADSPIELFRMGMPGVPSYVEWLLNELEEGSTIGFDGNVMAAIDVEELEAALKHKNITFSFQNDLVGQLWHDRPEDLPDPIFLHDIKYAGESRQSKFQRIRDLLQEQDVQAHLVAALDDIAWMLNIRGSDIQFNPVVISYAVITYAEVRLFINANKVPDDVRKALKDDGIKFSDYEEIFPYWQELPDETVVLIDPHKTGYKLKSIISQTCQIKEGKSIPGDLKAVKNEIELEGLKQAHIRDGVALVKWMMWLDQQSMDVPHTEITVAKKLAELRSLAENYRGLSFNTIAGYKANSAIGHYYPRLETTPTLKQEGILLIDSGAQYLDGTTDITRTLTLGEPIAEEKLVFTSVLKGLIRLSRMKFPNGTKGSELDLFAREPLWRQGWNCRHGIGHGVGAFLNVHEGPQRFAPGNSVSFMTGMVTTNEPGVYFEGKFGIRLENVLITVALENTEFGEFFGFETITLCPIDLDLVEVSLLSPEEKAWLNGYHQDVYEKLSPFLTGEEQAWLLHETRSI